MMRYFLFILILFLSTTIAQAQSATVTIDIDGTMSTITLSPTDQLAMRNDLLSISDWIAKAIQGKINKTRSRMVQQGITVLRAAGQGIPADDDAVINRLVARPGYKNRIQRDLESKL